MEAAFTLSPRAAAVHSTFAASRRLAKRNIVQLQERCPHSVVVRALLADDQLLPAANISSCGQLADAQQPRNISLSASNLSSPYASDYEEISRAHDNRVLTGLGGGASVDSATPPALIAVELLTATVVGSTSAVCESSLLNIAPFTEVNAVAAAAVIASGLITPEQPGSTPALAAFGAVDQHEQNEMVDRSINALMVGAAAIFAATKILTVDHDYWHGWTMFEILRFAPMHNWNAYEKALESNPVLAKMMISGIVYSLGDWIAQCYEGKAFLDFKRERIIRSGVVGFCLHGSLSHYYYHVCEALFPFKDWWVVPLKVAFDQTIWSAFWNSVYYVVLGLLRLESPFTIASNLRATFWPLLTAGWKLWPFAHLITYGFVPVEQRLLWVDTVELVWVTILSMYSNKIPEGRVDEESSSHDTVVQNSDVKLKQN